jgi:hypothetical protein
MRTGRIPAFRLNGPTEMETEHGRMVRKRVKHGPWRTTYEAVVEYIAHMMKAQEPDMVISIRTGLQKLR